ncbi:circular bacteriocin, circularin A/uberolysin family [Enterococcus faecalis]|nr:uberolysin/carnocyclin family circular bacteriocin [Enterococcus faecalis]NSN09572.1 circular bacteriocin, circularin A/uberolysin family [Enterococcus faecalis]NSU70590.1 circular bacteriocin, circularin A/uberolysin family [Enterococcus faecalis]
MKKLLCGILLLAVTFMFTNFNSPQLVATLGFSAKTANQIVDVVNAYGTASFAISLVLAITGAGASVSALVATVYQYIKKKGQKYAVTW